MKTDLSHGRARTLSEDDAYINRSILLQEIKSGRGNYKFPGVDFSRARREQGG